MKKTNPKELDFPTWSEVSEYPIVDCWGPFFCIARTRQSRESQNPLQHDISVVRGFDHL
jgi:hypothetical protein